MVLVESHLWDPLIREVKTDMNINRCS